MSPRCRPHLFTGLEASRRLPEQPDLRRLLLLDARPDGLHTTASLVHHQTQLVDVEAEHMIAERDAVMSAATQDREEDPAEGGLREDCDTRDAPRKTLPRTGPRQATLQTILTRWSSYETRLAMVNVYRKTVNRGNKPPGGGGTHSLFRVSCLSRLWGRGGEWEGERDGRGWTHSGRRPCTHSLCHVALLPLERLDVNVVGRAVGRLGARLSRGVREWGREGRV